MLKNLNERRALLKSDESNLSGTNESIMSAVRSSQYTCVKCLQYFSAKDLLIRHVFSHFNVLLNTPLDICQNCGQVFSNRSKLYGHHFEETKETTFKQPSLVELACAFCGDTFLSWCSLTKHVFTHVSAISAPLYVCTYYSEDFEDMSKLHFHKSTSKISPRGYYYDCQHNSPKCEQKIYATEQVETHKEKEPFSWNCYSKRLKYKNDCEISRSNEQSPVNHISKKSLKFSYSFEKRQKIDLSDTLFYRVCDHDSTNHSHVTGHQVIQFGEIPISCEVWRKSMHLKSLKGIHTYKRPIYCKLYGESFTESGSFKKHERVHLVERPFSCDVCGKSFKKSGTLSRHKRIHLGERPFTCDVCGKSFTVSWNLKMHKRIHLGERPFSCKICGNILY